MFSSSKSFEKILGEMMRTLFLHDSIREFKSIPQCLNSQGVNHVKMMLPKKKFSELGDFSNSVFSSDSYDLMIATGIAAPLAFSHRSQHIPIIMISPDWLRFDQSSRLKQNPENVIIIHSQDDQEISAEVSKKIADLYDLTFITFEGDYNSTSDFYYALSDGLKWIRSKIV